MGVATPASLGFRMPAEWEPHDATWIGWPHNASDWPGKLGAIELVYAEIVRKLAPGETVRILVNSQAHEARARRLLTHTGVDPARVEFFRLPTNRGWTRDYGPWFVTRDGDTAIVRFRFTGWAKYPDWSKDDRVAERVAQRLGLELLPARIGARPFVLEGGSIDGNGRGVLLTTEECLLDQETQVRNPGVARPELERAIRESLGATQIVWLGRGIAGDDTHGHVDDVCRFVNANTVVLCREPNARDDNHRPLEENRERLEGARTADAAKLEVIFLPMPAPLLYRGRRLPASYANFYISNAAVLVPTFNDPNDRKALGIMSELFRDRDVVGIHAVDLVWGFGTIHCLTQQQPRADGPPGPRTTRPHRSPAPRQE